MTAREWTDRMAQFSIVFGLGCLVLSRLGDHAHLIAWSLVGMGAVARTITNRISVRRPRGAWS